MISQENYDKSVRKWEKILHLLQDERSALPCYGGLGIRDEDEKLIEDEFVEVIGPCGFCDEFASPTDDENICYKCPLYLEDYCFTNPEGSSVFWDFVQSLNHLKERREEAIKLAEKMLERIRREEVGENDC